MSSRCVFSMLPFLFTSWPFVEDCAQQFSAVQKQAEAFKSLPRRDLCYQATAHCPSAHCQEHPSPCGQKKEKRSGPASSVTLSPPLSVATKSSKQSAKHQPPRRATWRGRELLFPLRRARWRIFCCFLKSYFLFLYWPHGLRYPNYQ